MKKIIQFIISRSEHTRKIIAGIGVALAGVMLFFAWTAGVSARLPLLGSEFDTSNTDSSTVGQEEPQIAATVSPMKGLIQSFQDLVRLFHGDPQTGTPENTSSSPTTPDATTTPIDALFNKVGDETHATTTSTSTQIIDTAATTTATTTPTSSGVVAPIESIGVDNLPPADELPGL